MAIESKIIEANQREIYKNECFGWQYVSISGNSILVNRDTSNICYQQLKDNETKYYGLLKEYNKNKTVVQKQEFNILIFLILFLLFIIPGVIYAILFIINQKQANEADYQYEVSKKEIKIQIDELLKESRNMFFNNETSKN